MIHIHEVGGSSPSNPTIDMKKSSKKLTLPDYQKLLKRLIKERGYHKETVPEVFMLLTEEVGELGKAIRKAGGMKTHADSKIHDIEDEAADVLWMLLDLCNRLGVNLEAAFAKKEAKNLKRERL